MKRYRWLGLLVAIGLIAAACGRSGSEHTANEGGGTPTTVGNAEVSRA